MLKQSDGKIGSKEFTALIVVLIVIISTDMTPSLLFPVGKNATWMFPIVWGAVISIPLFPLLSLLKLYKDKGLIDIIMNLTGKYIGFIISMILFSIILFASILNTRNYVDIIRDVFLPTTPHLAIYLIMIIASFYLSNLGLEVIGRVIWLITPYLIISLLILVFFLYQDLNFNNIFPITGPGITTIVKEGITQISIVAEIILISVFYPYCTNHKDYKRSSWFGLGIGILIYMTMLLLYTFTFGNSILETMPYPFHQITKYAGIERFFTNFDAFYLIFWFASAIVRFAFYIYLTSAIFSYSLKLSNVKSLLPAFSIVIILAGLLPKNPVQTTIELRGNFLLKQSWILFFFLPLILWLLAYLKGDYKK